MTSKHFVMKIRKSEQRRNQRMTHSQSDSNLLELYRHKCFRFRRNSNETLSRVFETVPEGRGMNKSAVLVHVLIVFACVCAHVCVRV